MHEQIYNACKKGDLATLKDLAQQAPQLIFQCHPNKKQFPFTAAALNNHLEVVEYLLNKHAENPDGFPISLGEVLWESHFDRDDDEGISTKYTREDVLNTIYKNFDSCKSADGAIKTHFAAAVGDIEFCRKNLASIFAPSDDGITPCYYILHYWPNNNIASLIPLEKITHDKVVVPSALKQKSDESYGKLLQAYVRLNETLNCVDNTDGSQLAAVQAAIDCAGKIIKLTDADREYHAEFRVALADRAIQYAEFLMTKKRDYQNAVMVLKEAIKTLKENTIGPEAVKVCKLYLTLAKICSLPILINNQADSSQYYYLALAVMCKSKRLDSATIVDLFTNWQKNYFIYSIEWHFLEVGRNAFSSYQNNNNFANLLQQAFHMLENSSLTPEQKSKWRSMLVKLIELLFIVEKINSSLRTNGTAFINAKENKAFIEAKLEELRKSTISPLTEIVEHHPSTASALVKMVTHLKQNNEDMGRKLFELGKENQHLKEKLAMLDQKLSLTSTATQPLVEIQPPITSTSKETSSDKVDQVVLKSKAERNLSGIPKDSPILSGAHVSMRVSKEEGEIVPPTAFKKK